MCVLISLETHIKLLLYDTHPFFFCRMRYRPIMCASSFILNIHFPYIYQLQV